MALKRRDRKLRPQAGSQGMRGVPSEISDAMRSPVGRMPRLPRTSVERFKKAKREGV